MSTCGAPRPAFGNAGGDEMMPGAGVRGLLNPPPLPGVLLLEGSGFDGLAELELSEETFPVWAWYWCWENPIFLARFTGRLPFPSRRRQ